MLISIFHQEYDVKIPSHVLDKIGDEAVQQVIMHLVKYGVDEGKSTGVVTLRRFMQQVVNFDRPIFPYMGIERAFNHDGFHNTSGWDRNSLSRLCRELAKALTEALPERMIPHKPQRRKTAAPEATAI